MDIMNLQNKRNTIVLILAVLLMPSVVWYFLFHTKKELVNSTLPDKTVISQIPVETDEDEYVGLISANMDNQNIYTSDKYGIKFTYPKEWRVGDNHLGYGTFQLFNYDVSQAGGKSLFPKGQNKIEASIVSTNIYGASTDYPETRRVIKQVLVAGQTATRFEIELTGGEKILSYIVSLPVTSDKYFSINMYGDPLNFHILDEVVGSIVWLSL